MQKQHPELTESLHQFITRWKMIGKEFPQTDQSDKPGLAVSWPDTHFPFYNALFLSDAISDAEVLEEKYGVRLSICELADIGDFFSSASTI